MRIFSDMHHKGLYKSLQLLFEKRLGYELYRPIGTEWFKEGYWMNAEIYNNHPDTIAQYLEIRDCVPTKNGLRNKDPELKDNYYLIKDDYLYEKAITLEQFKNMEIDVVIASYYSNIGPYKDLIKKFMPKAKFVMHMGNEWPVDWDMIDNLMSSTMPMEVPKDKNAVFYHQEFDLNIYTYRSPKEDNKILRSFVNCLPEHDIYKQDWLDFQELQRLLPDYKVESYGVSCPDGTIQKQEKIADLMAESKFGIHLKNHGDGFGHCGHQWMACGRPVIFRGSQYENRLLGKIFENYITGFDLDKIPMDKIAEQITTIKPGVYKSMCQSTYDKFRSVVDYDQEQQQVKKFMEDLL